MSEQWKTDGICTRCRRGDYCKTQCTRNKRAMKKLYAEAMRKYYEQLAAKANAEKPEPAEEEDNDQH